MARIELTIGRLLVLLAILGGFGCLAPVARAQLAPVPATGVQSFLDALWPAARARGISRATFDLAFAGFTPDPDVLVLGDRQPEFETPVGAYVTERVTLSRIETGRQKLLEHGALLAAIESAYGVDRRVLVAIWGMESAYGVAKGSRNVVRSLATLAMADERRAPFWRRELVAALKILEDGTLQPADFLGSWAGAMGHTQFIPSTYARHAVDFDRDGRRDVWNSIADALASTANYLRSVGWSAGVPWGFEVSLPADFDFGWSTPGRTLTLAKWLAAGIGVSPAAGRLSLGQHLQLILPAGARGPAFLVTGNFRVLLRYNQSAAYAIAVGHLADRFAGGPALTTRWPQEARTLARAEREELQRLLATRGLETGGLDGIIGDQTRAAIRATQKSLHLAEDGHPTLELLHRLRAPDAR